MSKLKQAFKKAIAEGFFDSEEEIQECFGSQSYNEGRFNCDKCPLSAECEAFEGSYQ